MINFESKLPFRVHVGAVDEPLESVKQHWFSERPEADSGDIWKLYAPSDRLLPIQVFIPLEILNYGDFEQPSIDLFDCTFDPAIGNNVTPIEFTNFSLKQVAGEGIYLVNNGDVPEVFDSMDTLPECKYYYLVFHFAASRRYVVSEWFYVPRAEVFTGLTKLVWWNSCDFANLLYQDGFKNVLWLDGTLAANEPVVEEEGIENLYGEFMQTSSRFVDNYNKEDVVPEFIMHALLATKMHDNIEVTLPGQIQSGIMRNSKIAITPDESGMYFVKITFEQLTRMAKGACCDNKVFGTVLPVVANADYIVLDSRLSTNTTPTSASFLRNDLGYNIQANAGTVLTSNSGSAAISANGTFVYTPPGGAITPPESFGYTIHDAFGTTASNTVTITRATPLAVDDTYTLHFTGDGTTVLPGDPSVLTNDILPVDFFAGLSTPPIWETPSVHNTITLTDLNFTTSTLVLNRTTGKFVLNIVNNPGVGFEIAFKYSIYYTASTKVDAIITIQFI